MFCKVKKSTVSVDNVDMDYIVFGSGSNNLVIIPGLGDSLKSVRLSAFVYRFMYRSFMKKYKIYVFSRKKVLPKKYSTKDMANDLAFVLNELKITNSNVIGISEGGMIAQHLAVEYPNLIRKLVLVVTSSRSNDILKKVISNWINLAKVNDYKQLYIDTTNKTYTKNTIRFINPFIFIIKFFYKPKSFDSFIIQSNACLNHDCFNELKKIKVKTLIIGGSDDKIVDVNSSIDINSQISNSILKIYDGYGHGLYKESKHYCEDLHLFLD